MEPNEKSSSKIGLVIAAVVVVVGIGAAVFALSNNTNTDNDSDNSSETKLNSKSTDTSNSEKAVVGSTVITFTDDGFDKPSYTSKAGEAVTVKNASKSDLQFSSDDHPAHTDHPELNERVLGPGESQTFVPAGAGTYGFHDHINDAFTGKLVVE